MTQEIMKMKYHPEIQDVYIGAKIRGYDTLVKRDLKDPKDIFKLIEKAALKKYKNIVQGYSQLRVETEEKIRKSKKTEVTLTEIYNELPDMFG